MAEQNANLGQLGAMWGSHRYAVASPTGLLIIAFVMSFAFDFKGSDGGSRIQVAMAVTNAMAFLMLAVRYRLALPAQGSKGLIFWAWMTFLLVGSVGAVLSDVQLGRYIRTIYPFVLFAEGYLVAWWVGRDGRRVPLMIGAMLWAGWCSLLFTAWWGFHFSDLSVTSIRFQILSPVMPFLIAVASYDLFFARWRRFRALATIAVVAALTALSVTRSMVLVVVLIFGALLCAWVINVLKGQVSVPKPLMRASIWLVGFGVAGVLVAAVFAPEIFGRWVQRGLVGQHNATLWTRVAAIQGQWEQLISSPAAFWTGMGFGHIYYYAQQFWPLVAGVVQRSTFTAPMSYPGEFMWVTPFYYAGLFAGGIGLAAIVYGTARLFRILCEFVALRRWDSLAMRPIGLSVLTFFGFLGLSFTANPFIFRGSALFWGISLGLAVSSYRGLANASAPPLRLAEG